MAYEKNATSLLLGYALSGTALQYTLQAADLVDAKVRLRIEDPNLERNILAWASIRKNADNVQVSLETLDGYDSNLMAIVDYDDTEKTLDVTFVSEFGQEIFVEDTLLVEANSNITDYYPDTVTLDRYVETGSDVFFVSDMKYDSRDGEINEYQPTDSEGRNQEHDMTSEEMANLVRKTGETNQVVEGGLQFELGVAYKADSLITSTISGGGVLQGQPLGAENITEPFKVFLLPEGAEYPSAYLDTKYLRYVEGATYHLDGENSRLLLADNADVDWLNDTFGISDNPGDRVRVLLDIPVNPQQGAVRAEDLHNAEAPTLEANGTVSGLHARGATQIALAGFSGAPVHPGAKFRLGNGDNTIYTVSGGNGTSNVRITPALTRTAKNNPTIYWHPSAILAQMEALFTGVVVPTGPVAGGQTEVEILVQNSADVGDFVYAHNGASVFMHKITGIDTGGSRPTLTLEPELQFDIDATDYFVVVDKAAATLVGKSQDDIITKASLLQYFIDNPIVIPEPPEVDLSGKSDVAGQEVTGTYSYYATDGSNGGWAAVSSQSISESSSQVYVETSQPDAGSFVKDVSLWTPPSSPVNKPLRMSYAGGSKPDTLFHFYAFEHPTLSEVGKAYVRFTEDAAGTVPLSDKHWNELVVLIRDGGLIWSDASYVDHSGPQDMMPREAIEKLMEVAINRHATSMPHSSGGGSTEPSPDPENPSAPTIEDGTPKNSGWKFDPAISALTTDPAAIGYLPSLLAPGYALSVDESVNTPAANAKALPVRLSDSAGIQPTTSFDFYLFAAPSAAIDSTNPYVRFATNEDGTGTLSQSQWDEIRPLVEQSGLIWVRQPAQDTSDPQSMMPRHEIEELDWNDHLDALKAASTKVKSNGDEMSGELQLPTDGSVRANIILMPSPMASYPNTIGNTYIEVMARDLRYIDLPDRDGVVDIQGPQLKIGIGSRDPVLQEGAFFLVGSRTLRSNKPNHYYVRLCTNTDGTGTLPDHIWDDIVTQVRASGGEVMALTFEQPNTFPGSVLPRKTIEKMIADSADANVPEAPTAEDIGAVKVKGDVLAGPIKAPRDTAWYETSWKNPDDILDINDVLTYGFPTINAPVRDLVVSTSDDQVPNGAVLPKLFLRSSGSGDSIVALGDPVYALVVASKTTDMTNPWIRLFKDAAGTTALRTVDLQGAPFTSLQSGHPFVVERAGVDTSHQDALITRRDMEEKVAEAVAGGETVDLSDGGVINDTVTIRGTEKVKSVTLADVGFFNASAPTADYYLVTGDFFMPVPEDVGPSTPPADAASVAVMVEAGVFGADAPSMATPLYVWRKKGDIAINGKTQALVRFTTNPEGTIGLNQSEWDTLKGRGNPVQFWTAATAVDTSDPRSLMAREEIESAIADAVSNSGSGGSGETPPVKPDDRLGIVSGASGTELSMLHHGFASDADVPKPPFTLAIAPNSYANFEAALEAGEEKTRQLVVNNAYLNGSTLKLAVTEHDVQWAKDNFYPFSGADTPEQPAGWAQYDAVTNPPPQTLKGVVSAELGNGRTRMGVMSGVSAGTILVTSDVYKADYMPKAPIKITVVSNVYDDPNEHVLGDLKRTIDVTAVEWDTDHLVLTCDPADSDWVTTWFTPKNQNDDPNAGAVWQDAGLDESKTAMTLGGVDYLNLPGVGPAAFKQEGTARYSPKGTDSLMWASWTPRILKPGTQMVIDGHKQIYRVADANTEYGMLVVRPDLEREVKADTKFFLWEPSEAKALDPTKPASIADLLTDGQLMAAVEGRRVVANTAANANATGNLIELDGADGFATNGGYLIHYTPEGGLTLHKVLSQRSTGGGKVEYTVTPNRKVAMTPWDVAWYVPAADYGAIANLPYNTPITKAMLEKALDALGSSSGDVSSTGAINQVIEGGLLAETEGGFYGKSLVTGYPSTTEITLGTQPLGDSNLSGPFTVVFGSPLADDPHQIVDPVWRPELVVDSYEINGSGSKLVTSDTTTLASIKALFDTSSNADGDKTWVWFKSGLDASKALVSRGELETALQFGMDPNGHPGHVVTTNGIKHVVNSGGIQLVAGTDRKKLLPGSTFVRNDGDPTVYTIHSVDDNDPCNVFFTPNLKRRLFGAINLHIRPPGFDKDNPNRPAIGSDLDFPQELIDKVGNVLTTAGNSSVNGNIIQLASTRGTNVGDYVLRKYANGYMMHKVTGVDTVSSPNELTVEPVLPESVNMNQSYLRINGLLMGLDALNLNEFVTRATFEKWAAENAGGGGGSDPDAVKKTGATNQEVDGGLVAAQGDVHFTKAAVIYFISSETYLLPGHPLGEEEITEEFALYIGSAMLDDPTKAIDSAFVRRVPCVSYTLDGANCRIKLKNYADSQWARTRFNTENGASDNDKAAFFMGIDVNTDNRLLSMAALEALPFGRSPLKGMLDDGLAVDAKPIGSYFMKFNVQPARMPLPGSKVVFNNGDPTVYTIGGPSGDFKSFKIQPALVKAHRDGCMAYLLKVTPGADEDLVSHAQMDYNAALDAHRLYDVYVDAECAAGQPVRMRNAYGGDAVGHLAYLNGVNQKGLHRITAQSGSSPYTLTLDPPTTGAVLEDEGVRIIDKAFADVVGLSLDTPVNLAMLEKFVADNSPDTSAFMTTAGGQMAGWPLMPSVAGSNEGWELDPINAVNVPESPTSNTWVTRGATGTAFQTGRWAEDGAPYRIGALDSTVPDSAMDFDVYLYVKNGDESSLTPRVSLSRNAETLTVLTQAEWDVVEPLLKSGGKLYQMASVGVDDIPDDAPVPKKHIAALAGGGGKSPGEVFLHAGSPTGAIPLGSAPVSRTTYAALFAEIGTTYGAGDGSTTFSLPPKPTDVAGVAAGLESVGAPMIEEVDFLMISETEALAPSDGNLKLYRLTFTGDSVSAAEEATIPGVFAPDSWCKTSDPNMLCWCNASDATGGAWTYNISTKEFKEISGYPGSSRAYRCCRSPLDANQVWFWDVSQWKIYVYDTSLKYWLSPSATSSFGISKDITSLQMVGDITNGLAWVGGTDGLWSIAPGGTTVKRPNTPNGLVSLIIPDPNTGKVYVGVLNTMYLYDPSDDSWVDLGGEWSGKSWESGDLSAGGKLFVGVNRDETTGGVYYREGEISATWYIQT